MATKKLRLSHAVDEFLTRKRYADATKENYTSLFHTLADSIGTDVYLENVTPAHLDKYLTGRYDRVSTINLRVAQMRVFFEWCVKNNYLKQNPARMLERAKGKKEGALSKHRIPLDAWPEILRMAGEQHPLNRITVAMGLYLGQRSRELTGIRLSDLHYDDTGTVVAITVHRSKVGDTSEVPVFAELADELALWLEWYVQHNGDTFGNLPPNAFLLPARVREWRKDEDGGFTGVRVDTPVTPHMPLRRPYGVVQQVLRATGWYRKGEGAHTLRRSLAVALYSADVDAGYAGALQNVQTMLGHASVQTTEGYLGTSLGKDRLNKRVQGKRLGPVNEAAPDNVIDFRRDHG